ncbi:MAG TPA: GldG family protein [Burkholderiales bacterium]|nr:GldG family protein [Burkholderiales bacterium]
MQINKKLRVQMLLQNSLFFVLLVAAVVLLSLVARDHRKQWDVSQNRRNSLTQASLNVLNQLHGPVIITAFATKQDPRLGDIRKLIRDFMQPYVRAKPDILLEFVDPAEQPKLTREAGVQVNGEMVVKFGAKSEHLTTLNEQTFTNLLMRLARTRQRLVMQIEGHGERKIDGKANFDFGDFGKQLAAKGFQTTSLNLALAQQVPENASVVVVTQPQVDYFPGEVAKLISYVDRGGNLLWLIDQEPLHGLESLADLLKLRLTPGVVIDPAAQELNAPATWALATSYGKHPITNDFKLITVFPFAREVSVGQNQDWQVIKLIEVAQRGWVENGKPDETARFDEKRDTRGPVTIGVALTRQLKGREQRVVIIGGGDFLANSYLGNAGNLDLGVNIINWLAQDEDLITIQPRATLDSNLYLGRSALTMITFGFLIAMPLIFLVTGAVIWWRRRKL